MAMILRLTAGVSPVRAREMSPRLLAWADAQALSDWDEVVEVTPGHFVLLVCRDWPRGEFEPGPEFPG